jgi:hypothetical protein
MPPGGACGAGGAGAVAAARLAPSPHAQLSGGFLRLQRQELLAGRAVTAMAYCPVAGSSLVACAYAPACMTPEQRLKVGGAGPRVQRLAAAGCRTPLTIAKVPGSASSR